MAKQTLNQTRTSGAWRISRRTMLQGMGTAISLPLLEVMDSPSSAVEPVSNKTTRLAYLYIPNGVADGAWLPEEAGPDGD